MRLLVSGSRECENWEFVQARLDDLKERNTIEVVIHGGAGGVDTLAGVWARRNDIPEEVYTADWDTHGKAAGPIRNTKMLDEGKPDVVVAFPTKTSKGTVNMINQTEKRRINLIVHDI
jgi:hypothetical protein